jgi:hypothetical protein
MSAEDPKPDLKSKISKWLAKSGYPLELFAYERMISAGYVCNKSALYTDPQSSIEREIDIFGEQSFQRTGQNTFTVQLLVECKKSKRPMLVLGSEPAKAPVRSTIFGARVVPSDFNNAQVLAEIAHERKIFSEDDFTPPFSELVRDGYSVVQAFVDSDRHFHRTLYGLAKAEHYFEEEHERLFQRMVEDQANCELFVAIQVCLLVVDAPLFNIYLENGRLEIEETKWTSVTMNLPWTPRPTSERRSNIQIVTKERLAAFLVQMESFAYWLSESAAYTNARHKLEEGRIGRSPSGQQTRWTPTNL